MDKTGLSFLLRMLMIALVSLAGLQLMALLVGTSPLSQAVLVSTTSAVLTYKIATIERRLRRAHARRRKVRLQMTLSSEPMRVA